MRAKRKSPKPFDFIGFEGSEPGGIRTHDLLIRSQNYKWLKLLIFKRLRDSHQSKLWFYYCFTLYTYPVSHESVLLSQCGVHEGTHTEPSYPLVVHRVPCGIPQLVQ